MQMDENALKLMKKCKDKEIASQGMGACQVLLKEMEKEKIDFEEDKPDESYMQMAQNISPEDVPKVLNMALKIKKRPDVSPELKNAANRLIRAIEAF
ncbi:MAG: hypothetical protein PQ975_11185 [Methanobacterium sp.]|jgi:hypothetical protein